MATPSKILFTYIFPANSATPGNDPAVTPENKDFAVPGEVYNNFPSTADRTPTSPDHAATSEAIGIGQQVTFPQKLMQVQEGKRESLAFELHDGVGQSLILVKNQILKMKNNLPETAETWGQLNTLAEMVTDSLQKIRNISYGLRPYELDLFGLTHALRSLAEEVAEATSWPLTLELTAIDNLFPKEHEIYIYRLIEECLEIIQKQAGVTAVQLRVHRTEQAIEWEIQVTGTTTFYAFLTNNFNTDFDLLRLQELLKILAGSVIFTEPVPRVTLMQIKLPTPQLPVTYEKD